MPIIRRSDRVPLPIVVCPVVAVVMLESWVARCVQVHTSCYPTLQHHNSYNRTENHRQWNAVWPPDDGRKDTRNTLRDSCLPINHYLLHPVGLAFTYLTPLFWAAYLNKFTNLGCPMTENQRRRLRVASGATAPGPTLSIKKTRPQTGKNFMNN